MTNFCKNVHCPEESWPVLLNQYCIFEEIQQALLTSHSPPAYIAQLAGSLSTLCCARDTTVVGMASPGGPP
jgi:hypothetical protein